MLQKIARIVPMTVFAAIALASLSMAVRAQVPGFEAASVRENTSGSMDGVFRRQPGRFTITNLSVAWIIQIAYDVRDYQILNAPTWTGRRYDVVATFTPPDASQDDVRVMLQRLLAERFSLRVHHEQRPLTAYELTRSSSNTLGPKLEPSSQTDCAEARLAAPECRRFANASSIKGVWSMTQLARSLDGMMDAPVVDRTNLTGVFDIDLQWGTDTVAAIGVAERAALLTALSEQLGLNLRTTRAPRDVIVVDAVSPATPD